MHATSVHALPLHGITPGCSLFPFCLLAMTHDLFCPRQLVETKAMLKPTMGLNQTPAASGSDT